ncbi:similar to Saccharomyces cerevisiae YFR020W CSS2 Protein of unknown function, secreted when constitutively expressed [Maudiozyma saulgeensis]|uniref:Uncharacterized protein n=1 Tax=Maudiozyma saulgeensis TaxID=1789683 RepID=A0A1X7R4C5_9SACH|nr:similar to Saccharomyces cerevisiae YFR020W CSS2 Protein of unknown function, secreted when constitutively expressed [Kazachstania saulgeensis]
MNWMPLYLFVCCVCLLSMASLSLSRALFAQLTEKPPYKNKINKLPRKQRQTAKRIGTKRKKLFLSQLKTVFFVWANSCHCCACVCVCVCVCVCLGRSWAKKIWQGNSPSCTMTGLARDGSLCYWVLISIFEDNWIVVVDDDDEFTSECVYMYIAQVL